MNNSQVINQAAEILKSSSYTVAFTGAGISVESGIPPFRGEDGLWSRYDPTVLDINYFLKHPLQSWQVIKEIFYDFFGKARPNPAHFALAEMEHQNLLKSVITQNIDHLHQQAGSRQVIEFHGTSHTLRCMKCNRQYTVEQIDLDTLPPRCAICGGLLKPDFVFFGEPIPEPARSDSFRNAELSEVMLIIGTTGEIMPASVLPSIAKENGAIIIEVNVEPSNYSASITDLFLRGKASRVLKELARDLALSV